MILPDSVRQALTSGHLAHLVTLNQDGSPQVTIVWIGLDGDEIVCALLPNHQKLKNIRGVCSCQIVRQSWTTTVCAALIRSSFPPFPPHCRKLLDQEMP
jgi:hypothetical protein